jgi:hypothetical protein
MAGVAITITRHWMIGNDQFIRALARNILTLQSNTIKGREPNILVFKAFVIGATNNRGAKAVCE